MAKPAFIYSFDNLGPYRFVELCGELLGARYKGFILGGVGADGGIDAEIDSVLGEWNPEGTDSLSNQIVQSGQKVIFQFKHKVTARTGQANARTQLIASYTGASSEVAKRLVVERNPDVYVLITNIEINSQFRSAFQDVCTAANPSIAHYQIIGLDELENWVTQATNLRHLYFPTIFDLPRYNLMVSVTAGAYWPSLGGWHGVQVGDSEELIQIVIYNTGMLPSYVSTIQFKIIQDGEEKIMQPLTWAPDPIMARINPEKGKSLEPGRSSAYSFRTKELKASFKHGFVSEITVIDEILNRYSVPVPEAIRQKLLEI